MNSNELQVRLSFKPDVSGLSRFATAMDRVVSGFRSRMEVVEALNKRLENGSRAMNTLLAQGAAYLGVGQLRQYVAAASQAEIAQRGLMQALQRAGLAGGANVNALNEQSAALERASAFSSEEISATQARFVAYGANIEQTQALTQATADLAAGTGIIADPSAHRTMGLL